LLCARRFLSEKRKNENRGVFIPSAILSQNGKSSKRASAVLDEPLALRGGDWAATPSTAGAPVGGFACFPFVSLGARTPRRRTADSPATANVPENPRLAQILIALARRAMYAAAGSNPNGLASGSPAGYAGVLGSQPSGFPWGFDAIRGFGFAVLAGFPLARFRDHLRQCPGFMLGRKRRAQLGRQGKPRILIRENRL